METGAFCNAIRGLFNRDRFDVRFSPERFGRHERVVITATCRGCDQETSEPSIPSDLWEHDEQFCEDVVRLMESALRDSCRCWMLAESRTVYVREDAFESGTWPRPPKRKKQIKPVVKTRRKIR